VMRVLVEFLQTPLSSSLSRVQEDCVRKYKSDSPSADIVQVEDAMPIHISRRDGAEIDVITPRRQNDLNPRDMETKSGSIMGGLEYAGPCGSSSLLMDSHTSFEHALKMTNAC
jgi:hypothetical protein